MCCSWQLSALRKCTARLSLELEVDREIILDCWHHAAYEFQEDEKGLSHLRFTAVRLYSINNCLHNLGVVAWMNTRLLHVNMRVLLHGHGLLGIVGGDVLKYFSLSQRVAILVLHHLRALAVVVRRSAIVSVVHNRAKRRDGGG